MLRQIHPGKVGQVGPLQHRGRETEQESQRLLRLGLPFEAEVLFECHLSRQEVEQRDAHSQWRGGRRRHAEPRAGAEGERAGLEGEKVEAVDVYVGAAQKIVHVRARHPSRKTTQVERGVDIHCHFDQHVELRTADVGKRRPGLPVEVVQLEAIELRQAEGADAKAREGEKVQTADAAEAGDRHTLGAQACLFFDAHPADIAREGRRVVE